jgi:hypothetical protein
MSLHYGLDEPPIVRARVGNEGPTDEERTDMLCIVDTSAQFIIPPKVINSNLG